ncbi:plant virulence effector HPE1-like domain-containing protein [Rhizobium sp. G21]|uniref:plant virulence effector HPE1-like domain-containing protein n=1 Tax=Rhizobium sp. G21 TaxID=2758439 RepID=UPI001603A049|nr:plant virulence effector HPE1-like domain-containing protein [Rhizobium sp. G21]MBB1248683.1 hypothetical protein [Rhizobium sp. G21]
MRLAIIAALAAVSAPALAGSIDVKSTDRTNRSVEFIRCDVCDSEADAAQEAEATGPVLKPGEQKIEIRTVNGQKMIYRTEAWMGGSPVVMVSKVPASLDAAVADTEPAPAETPTIDRDATTSAVSAGMQEMPPAIGETKAAAPAFDPGALQLRLP